MLALNGKEAGSGNTDRGEERHDQDRNIIVGRLPFEEAILLRDRKTLLCTLYMRGISFWVALVNIFGEDRKIMEDRVGYY